MKPTDTIGDDITLYRGDCLAVLPTLAAGSVDAVVTDPPYMLGAASARQSADKPMGWADINNAAHWYGLWMSECWRILKPSGSLWVFGNWKTHPVYQCAASQIGGMSVLSVVVWDKQWPSVGSMRGLRQNYELITVFGRADFGIEDRGLSDIWQCKWGGHKPTGHPQEKPVDLVRRIIELVSQKDGTICDPFMGSGTAAIASSAVLRSFIGIELDPTHYATALRRLTHAAGHSDDQLFSVLEATP